MPRRLDRFLVLLLQFAALIFLLTILPGPIPAGNVVNETAIHSFATAKAAIQAQTRGVPHA